MPDGAMVEPEIKPNFPTGEAKKLHQLTRDRWQEHLVLFSSVKNKVLAVNPDLEITFKLEVGKSCPLGLFAETAFKDQPPLKSPDGKRILEVWPKHSRSAILGRVIFKDQQGRLYRDIDLKGIGLLNTPYGRKEIIVWRPGLADKASGTRLGLLDSNIALADYQLTEEFLNAGIRTCRVMAIIGLEEIIAGGKKLSLKEAKKEEMIDDNFHPAIEVRAFAARARVADLKQTDYKHKDALLEDAKKIVSQELSLKELSDDEYLNWFGQTLGRSVGLIHKNGWYHNYLAPHNITLDSRIVDLDSLGRLNRHRQAEVDYTQAKDAFRNLIREVRGDKVILLDFIVEFEKAYEEAFPLKPESNTMPGRPQW